MQNKLCWITICIKEDHRLCMPVSLLPVLFGVSMTTVELLQLI